MLQQTTVATVIPRYQEFIARWPTFGAMAKAAQGDILNEWAGLGYYARARNLHKCAVEVAARGGFPQTEEELAELPGIGPYTAAAIAAIAFDKRAIVVDGNIERVTARLFAIETPLPKAKAEIKAAIGSVWPKARSGDFAQALMDLGASLCSPRNPSCSECPLRAPCAGHAAGIAADLPAKLMKAAKPTRRGVAYALFNSKGEILFERRPEKGLLGGMLGLPGTAWVAEKSPLPLMGEESRWRLAGTVRHTFTHFHLELDVMIAAAAKGVKPQENQRWIAPEAARLPTLMKKATLLAATGKKTT